MQRFPQKYQEEEKDVLVTEKLSVVSQTGHHS